MTKIKTDNDLAQRKNKVWSKEKIAHLIRLYRCHECLWNNYTEGYKNKDKRNEAIKQICTELRITKFDYGKKIHNLRNQFNAEMKKLERRIEESGGTVDGNSVDGVYFISHWDHYESLKFLKKVIAPRPSYQNSVNFQQLRFKQAPSDDEITDAGVSRVETYNTVNTNDATNDATPAAIIDNDEHTDFHFVEANDDEEDEDSDAEMVTDIAENIDQKYDPSSSMREVIITTLPAHNTDEIGGKTEGSTYFTALHRLANNAHTQSRVVASRPLQSQQLKSNNTSTPLTTQNIQSQDQLVSNTTDTRTASPSIKRPRRLSISTSTGAAVLRDQWDAFGEMVAAEFRNLNSDLSRKKLKRKIMHAMLEVGEEDDGININLANN